MEEVEGGGVGTRGRHQKSSSFLTLKSFPVASDGGGDIAPRLSSIEPATAVEQPVVAGNVLSENNVHKLLERARRFVHGKDLVHEGVADGREHLGVRLVDAL